MFSGVLASFAEIVIGVLLRIDQKLDRLTKVQHEQGEKTMAAFANIQAQVVRLMKDVTDEISAVEDKLRVAAAAPSEADLQGIADQLSSLGGKIESETATLTGTGSTGTGTGDTGSTGTTGTGSTDTGTGTTGTDTGTGTTGDTGTTTDTGSTDPNAPVPNQT